MVVVASHTRSGILAHVCSPGVPCRYTATCVAQNIKSFHLADPHSILTKGLLFWRANQDLLKVATYVWVVTKGDYALQPNIAKLKSIPFHKGEI